MRTFFAIALLLAAGQASAQTFETDRLTGNTVFMAIQCDMGRFANDAIKIGMDENMQAHVAYTWKVEKGKAVSAKAEISLGKFLSWIAAGPSVEASTSWTHIGDDGLEGDFNLHPDNRDACNQKVKPRVPVGVYTCLTNNKFPIKAKIVSHCNKNLVALGKLTAKGTVNWLVFSFEPEGSFDLKVTYDIKISAPVKEGKPDKPKVADKRS